VPSADCYLLISNREARLVASNGDRRLHPDVIPNGREAAGRNLLFTMTSSDRKWAEPARAHLLFVLLYLDVMTYMYRRKRHDDVFLQEHFSLFRNQPDS